MGRRVLFTAKTVIGQLITFTILLIILLHHERHRQPAEELRQAAGQDGGALHCSTILAGLFAFTVASHLIPHLTTAAEPTAEAATKLASTSASRSAPVRGDVGPGRRLRVRHRHQRHPGHRPAPGRRSGRDIIDRLLARVIIPLLPFYIAGVFVEMTVEGTVFATLKTFGWCW